MSYGLKHDKIGREKIVQIHAPMMARIGFDHQMSESLVMARGCGHFQPSAVLHSVGCYGVQFGTRF